MQFTNTSFSEPGEQPVLPAADQNETAQPDKNNLSTNEKQGIAGKVQTEDQNAIAPEKSSSGPEEKDITD